MVLLPEEAEMTLAELRQMAAQQQHQIEAQQQLLVAKEQRLKFLKQQEARHHSLAEQQSDTVNLQKLREKVEAQEIKLRQLRALRGQVEQQKTNNVNLGTELESIRALFSEKEKELNLAVAKVEELTRQLDEIRNSNKRKTCFVSALTPELEKLRRELLYRTKLAEQQNNHIAEQRECIAQRQQNIALLDKKIGELTQRLHRKRLLNQQLASQIHNVSLSKHYPPTSNRVNIYPVSNVAAVEPIQRESQDSEQSQDDLAAKLRLSHQGDLSEFCQTKNDPKYQTLPYNTKFSLKGRQYQDDFAPHTEDEALPPFSSASTPSLLQTTLAPVKSVHSVYNFAPRPFTTASSVPVTRVTPHQHTIQNKDIVNHPAASDLGPPSESVSADSSGRLSEKQRPENFVSLVHSQSPQREVKLPPSVESRINNEVHKKPNKEDIGVLTPSSNSSVIKPVVPPKPSFPLKPIPPPRQTSISSTTKENGCDEKTDIISMALSVLQHSSERDKSAFRYPTREVTASGSKVTTYFPKPTVQFPDQSSRYVSEDCDLPDGLKRKPTPGHLPIKPKPLTIRKTPGLEPPKLKVQQNSGVGNYRKIPEFNTAVQNLKPTIVPSVIKPLQKEPPDYGSSPCEESTEINESVSKENVQSGGETQIVSDEAPIGQDTSFNTRETPTESWDVQQPIENKQESHDVNAWSEEQNSADEKSDSTTGSIECLQTTEVKDDGVPGETKELVVHQSAALRRVKKGNLKTEGSVRSPRRVSFDPLALLLDAALEGELELVKKTAAEVPNPSAANDEGITALHNAICAGHFEIVTFLVEFGCDVNAQDSDGWTPLHCAASCNNLPMVKFLVENGACIFATTLSDHETAAEKCEEEEEGFDGCSEYLYGLQENLGVINEGVVYAVYDYEVQNADELSFKDGDMLSVLRKGDDQENEWWWSRLADQEGYVPRNLLGLYPRVTARKDFDKPS